MTVITINKKTKEGKMLLELAKILSEKGKGISISEKSPYNPEFVEKITAARKGISKNKGEKIDLDDLWN